MEFCKITADRFEELKELQRQYKAEIGEDAPSEMDFKRLFKAIREKKITFFGCICEESLVGCCSVSETFSTFEYASAGALEDVFIFPAYRKRGILRSLVKYAWNNSDISSLTVGCADCDLEMYKAVGFKIPLGNLLAYGE